MKTFFKKLFILIAIVSAISIGTNLISSAPTFAAPNGSMTELNNDNGGGGSGSSTPSTPASTAGCSYFLGLQSWNCGLGDDITLTDGSDIATKVSVIASNVLVDLTIIAAYLSIGFIVYGGYLYIMSYGDPVKTANGKKTLTRAFIGTAIVLLSNVILNTIRITLIGNASLSSCIDNANCVSGAETGALVIEVINWFIGVAGVVSAIFIVVGGVGYVTSAGDSGKLQKAKNTIMYSLIGLVVVALSFAISAFVSNLVQGAEDSGSGSGSSSVNQSTNNP